MFNPDEIFLDYNPCDKPNGFGHKKEDASQGILFLFIFSII